jgi:hypothetical protein
MSNKRRILLSATIVTLLALVVISQFGRPPQSHELVIRIEHVDAPEECYIGGRFWRPRSSRSSEPTRPGWDYYCGGIWATNGLYHLPTSGELFSRHDTRKNLLGQLSPGCSFRVLIHGQGTPFTMEEGYTNRSKHVISRIIEPLGCD